MICIEILHYSSEAYNFLVCPANLNKDQLITIVNKIEGQITKNCMLYAQLSPTPPKSMFIECYCLNPKLIMEGRG